MCGWSLVTVAFCDTTHRGKPAREGVPRFLGSSVATTSHGSPAPSRAVQWKGETPMIIHPATERDAPRWAGSTCCSPADHPVVPRPHLPVTGDRRDFTWWSYRKLNMKHIMQKKSKIPLTFPKSQNKIFSSEKCTDVRQPSMCGPGLGRWFERLGPIS